jgi:Concanavalin A-like lectin/glucanases superfamily
MALADNLVAYYSLEDLTDATGGGRSLTNNSAVTFTAGKISNAATAAAVNANYLYRNDAYGLTNTAAYSISFWLKVNTDPTADYDIFSKCINGPSGNTGQIARMVYEYNGGARRIRFYQNTLAGTTFFDISGNIGDGTWHHYVIIFSQPPSPVYQMTVK